MSVWMGSLKYISWNTTRIVHKTYLKHSITILLPSCNIHPQNLHLFHKQTIGEQPYNFWIANNPCFPIQSSCTKIPSYSQTQCILISTLEQAFIIHKWRYNVITKDPILTSLPISWQILHSPRHRTTMCYWHLCYLQVVALCSLEKTLRHLHPQCNLAIIIVNVAFTLP
jgi:hypothetical protein